MIVGYMRIMRRTIRRYGLNTNYSKEQIEVCRKRLSELLERVDSLVF